MRKKLGPPFVLQWVLLVEIGSWLPSKFFTRCWVADREAVVTVETGPLVRISEIDKRCFPHAVKSKRVRQSCLVSSIVMGDPRTT